MKIYSIKDVKVGFCKPVTYPNDAAAIRNFNGYINYISKSDSEIDISSDLELWYLGELDDLTGSIVSDPKFLSNKLIEVDK